MHHTDGRPHQSEAAAAHELLHDSLLLRPIGHPAAILDPGTKEYYAMLSEEPSIHPSMAETRYMVRCPCST